MNNTEFMHYLRNLDEADGFNKPLSRFYKNHLGVDELITLPASYWDYVVWLEDRGDSDIGEWVIHCGKHPFEDWTTSHLLMYWLWMDDCGRHEQGLPTYRDVPPDGAVFARLPENEN